MLAALLRPPPLNPSGLNNRMEGAIVRRGTDQRTKTPRCTPICTPMGPGLSVSVSGAFRLFSVSCGPSVAVRKPLI